MNVTQRARRYLEGAPLGARSYLDGTSEIMASNFIEEVKLSRGIIFYFYELYIPENLQNYWGFSEYIICDLTASRQEKEGFYEDDIN